MVRKNSGGIVFIKTVAFFSALALTPFLAALAPEECSKELLLAYFPESFLNKTLKEFKVPESEWTAINQELAAKDRDVVTQVEEKASKLNPNPLKDPQQRSAAIKIFKDTLYEVFSSVMKAHGVTDNTQIQAMLDDIQQQKAKRFAQCLKETPAGG
jgi:hypothetical protein